MSILNDSVTDLSNKKREKSFDYHFKLRYFFEYINRLLYKIFYDLYNVHPSSLKGTKNIKAFLQEYSTPSFKEQYDNIYENYYDYELYENTPNFDLSFCLLESLKCFFMEKSKTAFESLFECLLKVKKFKRNFKAYYKYKVERIKELYDNLLKINLELCDLMNKIVEGGEISSKINYLEVKVGTNKDMTKLWNSNLLKCPSLIRKLLEMPTEKGLKKFYDACFEELKEKYNKLNACPFSIIGKQFTSDEEIFVPIYIEIKKNIFSYDKLLEFKYEKEKKPRRFVIIRGDAGYGKSTLCKKYTKEWLNKKNKSEYHLVLFIEVKRAKESSLYQYLKNILLPNALNDSDDEYEVLQFLRMLNVLIIIDGFDEKSKEAEKLIKNTVHELKDKKWLITTRPHYDEIYNLFNEIPHYCAEIRLFEDKHVKDLIEKIWNNMKGYYDKERYIKYIAELPHDFQMIIKIPLMNIMLINLWINSKEESIPLTKLTFTTLYSKIFELQKKIAIDKIQVQITKRNDIINKMIQDVIHILAEYLYKNQLDNGNEKNNFNIEIILNKVKIDKEHCKKFLSSLFSTNSNLRGEDQYEFLHRTQVEYLVALHATSLLNTQESNKFKDLLIFKDNSEIEKTKLFLFTLGLLSNNDNLDKYKEEVSTFLEPYSKNYNFLWSIISETMKENEADLKPNNYICQILKKLLQCSNNFFSLDDSNIISALNILCYIEFLPDICEINIMNNDPYSIPTFFISLKKLDSLKQNIKCKTILDLKFEKHLKQKMNQNSDIFLTLISSWATLNSFHGSLSIDSFELLTEHKNIQEIKLKIKSADVLKKLLQIQKRRNFTKLKNLILVFEEPLQISRKHNLELKNIKISVEILCADNIKMLLSMLINLTRK